MQATVTVLQIRHYCEMPREVYSTRNVTKMQSPRKGYSLHANTRKWWFNMFYLCWQGGRNGGDDVGASTEGMGCSRPEAIGMGRCLPAPHARRRRPLPYPLQLGPPPLGVHLHAEPPRLCFHLYASLLTSVSIIAMELVRGQQSESTMTIFCQGT